MMQLISFAASLLTFLLGHVLLWYVSLKFFHISARAEQITLGAIIAALFVSVFVSSYLIHKRDNWWLRFYYIVSGLWIGLFGNLCLMAFLIIVVNVVGWRFGFYLPAWALNTIFFGGGLALSGLGVYNALMPTIREYEVPIKDLPAAWDNKTVVHISDVHLGAVYRQKFFSRLIDRANALNPEAVFITGDLFDGMEAEFSWLNHPLTRLRAPRGIYYSYGNHDLYLGYNRVKELLSGNPVTILDNKMVVVADLQIIGINYSFNHDFDLEEAILKQAGYSPARASILLFHAPRNIPLAKKVGIDLQLSGHTHDGQMFPNNFLIKWAHQGYGYGFFQEGDFSLIVNGGAGTWGPPMRTSSRAEIIKIILKKK
jgi:predicted MPP superfamily phosphohydrolase